MPLGSLTADQEIVDGSLMTAASVGDNSEGAGGAAVALLPAAQRHRMKANDNVTDR